MTVPLQDDFERFFFFLKETGIHSLSTRLKNEFELSKKRKYSNVIFYKKIMLKEVATYIEMVSNLNAVVIVFLNDSNFREVCLKFLEYFNKLIQSITISRFTNICLQKVVKKIDNSLQWKFLINEERIDLFKKELVTLILQSNNQQILISFFYLIEYFIRYNKFTQFQTVEMINDKENDKFIQCSNEIKFFVANDILTKEIITKMIFYLKWIIPKNYKIIVNDILFFVNIVFQNEEILHPIFDFFYLIKSYLTKPYLLGLVIEVTNVELILTLLFRILQKDKNLLELSRCLFYYFHLCKIVKCNYQVELPAVATVYTVANKPLPATPTTNSTAVGGKDFSHELIGPKVNKRKMIFSILKARLNTLKRKFKK